MLVDLARNDVGRVAEYGSVELSDIMHVERYSHVMHISSTVTGKLAPGKTALDALRAGCHVSLRSPPEVSCGDSSHPAYARYDQAAVSCLHNTGQRRLIGRRHRLETRPAVVTE